MSKHNETAATKAAQYLDELAEELREETNEEYFLRLVEDSEQS